MMSTIECLSERIGLIDQTITVHFDRMKEIGKLLAMPLSQAKSLLDALTQLEGDGNLSELQATDMLESVAIRRIKPSQAIQILGKRQP